MILGSPFETLAQEAELYSQIQATDWGQDGSVTNYQYDANGSMTQKVKTEPGKTTTEIFEYNLANRLSAHTKTVDDGIDVLVTETAYTYNQDGIRVKSQSTTTINEQLTDESTNIYLIDSFNHTGYAQVLEGFDGVSATPVMSYVIGDDVLSQATSADVSHFLYDGHGSTRQLADSQATITAQYSFDAYGHMLGTQAGATPQQETSLLYSGEYFDTSLQNYYLRARYYDQNTGRFNRLDPVMGSTFDPASLHKYAYAHNDPVNNWDPSGAFTLLELLVVVGIIAILVIAVTIHSFARRRPRMVNVRISINPAGMHSSFSPTAVQQLLQQQSDTNLFHRLVSGHRVRMSITVDATNPSQLGWFGSRNTNYVARFNWSDAPPVAGGRLVQRGGDSVTAFNQRIDNAAADEGATLGDQWWVNVLMHEVIWGTASGNQADSLTAPEYEIGSGTQSTSQPTTIRPSSRRDILRAFGLVEK